MTAALKTVLVDALDPTRSGSLTMNASMIQLSQGMGRPSVWWTLDRKRSKDQAAPWYRRLLG